MLPPVIANGADSAPRPQYGCEVVEIVTLGKFDAGIVVVANTVVPLLLSIRAVMSPGVPDAVKATFIAVIEKLSPDVIGKLCRIRVAPPKEVDIALVLPLKHDVAGNPHQKSAVPLSSWSR